MMVLSNYLKANLISRKINTDYYSFAISFEIVMEILEISVKIKSVYCVCILQSNYQFCWENNFKEKILITVWDFVIKEC